MATLSRRTWKVQEFQAHSANVNCLALGHKSGTVMVTGGDDKKVNLWAIGKQGCFMSLSGHITPVDCVQFNHSEELVCAGSRAGALKVWDLEAAKLVRTLNGHKQSIKCVDFHPYGDYDVFVSGSDDSTMKIWDARKKGVIYTYNGHQSTVNSVKFSPDGQWVATGGEDSTVKIWDIRIGRMIKEFKNHLNAVTCVEFHPYEFLLVSGSMDRSVNFFDLENFNLVSSECDLGVIRTLCFNSDGDYLCTGTRDYMKIIGWEPNRLHDTVPVNWGKVCDISANKTKLVGASFNSTNVQIHVVDLQKCRPMGSMFDSDRSSVSQNPLAPHTSIRRSFSKAESPVSLKGRTNDVKPIEESTSGTDPEEESPADITNVHDYQEIFSGKGLARTPPPEPFQEPEREFTPAPNVFQNTYIDPAEPQIITDHQITESYETLSLDDNVNNYRNLEPPAKNSNKYSRSKSNLDQVHLNQMKKQRERENVVPNNRARPVAKFNLQRQTSLKETNDKARTKNQSDGMKHSASEASINRGLTSSRVQSRKNSLSRPSRISTSVSNVSIARNAARITEPTNSQASSVDYYSNKSSPVEDMPIDENELVPSSLDRPMGIDYDDFLPKFSELGHRQLQPEMSEAEGLGMLMRGHQSVISILETRKRGARLVFAHFKNKDMKSAVETASMMGDNSTFVDILGVINTKYSSWNLDICVMVLPKLLELMHSKYEQHITLSCASLKLILRHFGSVIRSNVQSPVGSFGVDIPREERYQKSVKCHEMLSQLRNYISKKQSLPGIVGSTFRETLTMMVAVLD